MMSLREALPNDGPFNPIAPEFVCGAARDVLAKMPPAFAQMAYLDPPFGTGLVWTGSAGSFVDRFEWSRSSDLALNDIRAWRPEAGAIIEALPIGAAARAYCVSMMEIVRAVHRGLCATGTMWLHCDDTMGAYLKVLADLVFGAPLWMGDLIWRRTSGSHTTEKTFGRVHDTIFVYAKSRAARWRLWRLRSDLVWGDPFEDFGIAGFLENHLNAGASERVGYPTQKPVSLVSRLIKAATLPGDVVLDPTCGSGTTLVAAAALGRRSVGIDISEAAIAIARGRFVSAIPQQRDLFAA